MVRVVLKGLLLWDIFHWVISAKVLVGIKTAINSEAILGNRNIGEGMAFCQSGYFEKNAVKLSYGKPQACRKCET